MKAYCLIHRVQFCKMEGVLEADGGVAGQCEGTQCHWTIHLKYLKMVTLISVYFNTIILKG